MSEAGMAEEARVEQLALERELDELRHHDRYETSALARLADLLGDMDSSPDIREARSLVRDLRERDRRENVLHRGLAVAVGGSR